MNLEDKDRTLRIDVSTRRVTATWMSACGEKGPRGLALEPKDQLLVVACTNHQAGEEYLERLTPSPSPLLP